MRCLYAGWAENSSLATKRVPRETPSAPRPLARATPAPSPMPPEASTGTGLIASTTAGSSVQIDVVPLTCPPASTPCAITASTPAAAAAFASSSEPTWMMIRTPCRCASSTYGAGSPQKRMTAATRSVIAALTCWRVIALSSSEESRSSMMKLTPNGRGVRSRTWAISPGIASGRKADAPITPKPPALETAAARSGPAPVPMPAENIGYSIPRSRQRGVRSPWAMSGIVAYGDGLNFEQVGLDLPGLSGKIARRHQSAFGIHGHLARYEYDSPTGCDHDLGVGGRVPPSILDFAYQALRFGSSR